MKKLKFLIVAFVVAFATQGVLAVTLPSTSYTPSANMIDNGGAHTAVYGTKFTGSFISLGDYSDCREGAVDPETNEHIECSTCCIKYGNPYIEGQKAIYDACLSECKGGDGTELGYEEPLDESAMLLFLMCASVFCSAMIRSLYIRDSKSINQL